MASVGPLDTPADLLVVVAGVEPGQHPLPGVLGVVVGSAAQQPADPEQANTKIGRDRGHGVPVLPTRRRASRCVR